MEFSLFAHMERLAPEQDHQHLYDEFLSLCTMADVTRDPFTALYGHMTTERIRKVLSCLPPCSYNQFIFEEPHYEEHGAEEGDGSTQTISMLIYFDDNLVEFHKEYVTFGELSLIGEIGGQLGLFLGVSFYQVLSEGLDKIWYKRFLDVEQLYSNHFFHTLLESVI